MANLQYLMNGKGVTTAVVIPILEWQKIQEQLGSPDIPIWQKDELDKRLKFLAEHPNDLEDFDFAMKQIEDEL
jgi:hypothetical protein